jgi:ABC-2 type transport system ATP-binding protein
MSAIIVKDLFKTYNNGIRALDGLSLSVKRGEIFSLLGQNGAGKSTLIKVLTTYLHPTSGKIFMFGKDVDHEAAEIRSEIGCVAQKTSIDTHLSLTENMHFQGKLYKIPKQDAKKRMEKLIDCFGLENYLQYPTVGMDIQSRMAMWDMVRKIRTDFGTTIFLTTHYLEEADQLSDTICIIKKRKAVIQGTPKTLREYLRQNMLTISFSTKKEAKDCFEALKGEMELKASDLRSEKIITGIKKDSTDLKKAARWLLKHDIPFRGIEIIQPTLEDIFINLTKEKGKAGY